MKSSRTKRLKFAQNSIDYIVYGNPKTVSQLVFDYGYEPPKNPHELVKATKQLIKQEGQSVIKELIKIHPDKSAILQVQKGTEDNFCGACSSHSYQPEDNFCGVCGHSSYDGNRQAFMAQLANMTLDELNTYYKNQLARSNKNKENTQLAQEVEIVWNELRQRKAEANKEVETESDNKSCPYCSKEGLLLLGGLVFAAGILVGSSRTIHSFVNE